jgi:hypothetical protein
LWISLKEGRGGERRSKDRVILRKTLILGGSLSKRGEGVKKEVQRQGDFKENPNTCLTISIYFTYSSSGSSSLRKQNLDFRFKNQTWF